MLFLAVARLMARFMVRKARDEEGKEAEIPWYEYVNGMPTHPKPFRSEPVERSKE